MIFAKFDTKRSVWAAAAQCSSILDALGSLAQASSKPGFIRPTILECPSDAKPCIHVSQGRHPCVDNTHNGGQFIPNNLTLGAREKDDSDGQRVLLLSGPNMVGHHNQYSSPHHLSSFLTGCYTLGWKKYSPSPDMFDSYSCPDWMFRPRGKVLADPGRSDFHATRSERPDPTWTIHIFC